MAYTVPTLDELVVLAQERHRAEMPGTDAFLWPNTEFVFMKSVAGMVHMNFQYLDWIKDQRFATTADGDELDNAARAYKIVRKPSVRSTGVIVVTGTPLHTIAEGTIFARSDSVEFRTIVDMTLETGGTGIVAVDAVEPGSDGNTAAGSPLTAARYDADITAVAVDEIGLGAGADIENDESLRARLLFRMQNPPRGGAETDYIQWAWEVPGVTRVWVVNLAYGPGTVGVWFMSDDSTPDGIPSDVLIQQVQERVEGKRPETARVIVQAPIPASIDVRIGGIRPGRTQQDLIEVEMRDVFRRRVAPSMPRYPFTLRNNLLWQAVGRITGDATHSIIVPADAEMPLNYIPVMGSICYLT